MVQQWQSMQPAPAHPESAKALCSNSGHSRFISCTSVVCGCDLCRDSHTKTFYRALQCFLYDFWEQKECQISTDPQDVTDFLKLPAADGVSNCFHLSGEGGGRICIIHVALATSLLNSTEVSGTMQCWQQCSNWSTLCKAATSSLTVNSTDVSCSVPSSQDIVAQFAGSASCLTGRNSSLIMQLQQANVHGGQQRCQNSY